ncbi:MAG: glycosyltransferase family 2 protein [Gaiellaceae bacterium]|jgi:glycosyltransferase involved in cell wall biosynthesis
MRLRRRITPFRDRRTAVVAPLPRRLAIVPAFNEEDSVGDVIEEIRGFDTALDVVVVDDGSSDRTAEVARAHRAHVVSLPFNLGIGAAVQTGFRYALANGFDLAVQVDADGQHDPSELPKLFSPLEAGKADLVIGSRFAGERAFRSSFMRRLGIRLFSLTVSAIARRRLTDATSGFRAVNRRGIALFAADYPHDYPEVEATVMVVKHRLRVSEVPVRMRERAAGRSSITALRAVYYIFKVLLALFVELFRPRKEPREVA